MKKNRNDYYKITVIDEENTIWFQGTFYLDGEKQAHRFATDIQNRFVDEYNQIFGYVINNTTKGEDVQ